MSGGPDGMRPSFEQRLKAGVEMMVSNNLILGIGVVSLLALLFGSSAAAGSHADEIFVAFLIFPAVLVLRFLLGFFRAGRGPAQPD